MKIIFQKIAFLIVGTYLVVTLVASNQIARSNPNNDIKNVENCLVDRLLGKECIVPKQPKLSPTQTPSPTPNVNLTDKER
ncbi:MAG: peptidase M15, partial [Cyanobacteria bacterium J06649_11]